MKSQLEKCHGFMLENSPSKTNYSCFGTCHFFQLKECFPDKQPTFLSLETGRTWQRMMLSSLNLFSGKTPHLWSFEHTCSKLQGLILHFCMLASTWIQTVDKIHFIRIPVSVVFAQLAMVNLRFSFMHPSPCLSFIPLHLVKFKCLLFIMLAFNMAMSPSAKCDYDWLTGQNIGRQWALCVVVMLHFLPIE